ncbi:unnamed protein product [Hermetia illucens]|uniref:FYVE-type domain-containing protein n=2 Tax=Hermetia illucens TaxID=343691 RepID=A0A7R8V0Y0_HERIL|nr:unnamed protein product [Hermetia illucens]
MAALPKLEEDNSIFTSKTAKSCVNQLSIAFRQFGWSSQVGLVFCVFCSASQVWLEITERNYPKTMEEARPVDGDPPNNEEDLKAQIAKLTAEKRKQHDEFNIQRARLKELYLQKEAECKKLSGEMENMQKQLDDVKSQLVVVEYRTESDRQQQERKAQEEIASLQQLVQDTIEESSICKAELEHLREEMIRVKQENRDLRELIAHQQQDTPSLAPVLSHVKKTLARKLGADSSASNETSLDESMRKAQEDAQVLRSLVVPLEEEIKALKEKLRATDEELQSYRGANIEQPSAEVIATTSQNEICMQSSPIHLKPDATDSMTKSTSMDYIQCEMCQNYETQLVQAQKQLTDEKEKNEKLQKAILDTREELKKESALRRDLEEEWQQKREIHKEEVQSLTEQVKKSEKELINLQQQFLDTKDEITRQLYRLTADREQINKHLETLQGDNDFLSGRYLDTSEEIQNQRIDLPNNVDELHILLLKQRDELIQARVGVEFERRKCVSYVDETNLLRDQLESIDSERKAYDKKVQSHIRSLEERLKAVLNKEQNTELMKKTFERKEAELNEQLSELRVQVIDLREANEKLEKAHSDSKSQIKILQDELSTSEHVQKDFVKLSQSLQITLEKIRQADTQVRWQDDEDVEKCPNCSVLFTVTCRKQHCRHCGTIYCDKCLTKTVPSGPRNKPARVCDICHTLLIPNTAPYFSQAPPQSPT